jgi:hypothetical protein
MGWSSSWVAIQGCTKEALLEQAGLVETGEEVFPGSGEAAFSIGEFANAWMVLFSEDFDWATPECIVELSQLGLAVGCQFEDKVAMTSMACAAREGVELWRVFHDNEQSIYRLDVTGTPPAELAEIRERLFREQKRIGGEDSDVDYVHDIPFELARAFCGYRHDEDESSFIALAPEGAHGAAEAKSGPGLLSKLLGLFAPRD